MKVIRRSTRRLWRWLVDGILGVHDTPHRIALGVAVGLFVAITPTIGFQMALTVLIAALLRANKVVGLPMCWISNPATLWVYILPYRLGCWLLGQPPRLRELWAALRQMVGVSGTLGERWYGLERALWNVSGPLLLGCVLVGLLLGLVAYVVTYYSVIGYRYRLAELRERLGRGHAAPTHEPTQPTAPAETDEVRR